MYSPLLQSEVRRGNLSKVSTHSDYSYPAIILLAFSIFTAIQTFLVLDLLLLGVTLLAPFYYLIALEMFVPMALIWLVSERRNAWGLALFQNPIAQQSTVRVNWVNKAEDGLKRTITFREDRD